MTAIEEAVAGRAAGRRGSVGDMERYEFRHALIA